MNESTKFLQGWAERYPHSAAKLVEALRVTPQGVTVYIPATHQTQVAPESVQASGK